MPYVNKPRPYKKEYKQQKARGEHDERMKRQELRREYDAKGIDRSGKDIDHKVPLSKNGSNSMANSRLRTPSQNRSFSRNPDGSVKRNEPKKGRK